MDQKRKHLNKVIAVEPSPSYRLFLPGDIHEDYDDGVASFWIKEEPLLLQLSSYMRDDLNQITARDRLKDRVAKHPGVWRIWDSDIIPDSIVDQATGEFIDKNGLVWLHSYLVWPKLAIYVTISGPKNDVTDQNSWARKGINTIEILRKNS